MQETLCKSQYNTTNENIFHNKGGYLLEERQTHRRTLGLKMIEGKEYLLNYEYSDLLSTGDVFANYKAFCEHIGEEPREGGNARKYHIQHLENYIVWEQKGHRWVIKYASDTPLFSEKTTLSSTPKFIFHEEMKVLFLRYLVKNFRFEEEPKIHNFILPSFEVNKILGFHGDFFKKIFGYKTIIHERIGVDYEIVEEVREHLLQNMKDRRNALFKHLRDSYEIEVRNIVAYRPMGQWRYQELSAEQRSMIKEIEQSVRNDLNLEDGVNVDLTPLKFVYYEERLYRLRQIGIHHTAHTWKITVPHYTMIQLKEEALRQAHKFGLTYSAKDFNEVYQEYIIELNKQRKSVDLASAYLQKGKRLSRAQRAQYLSDYEVAVRVCCNIE